MAHHHRGTGWTAQSDLAQPGVGDRGYQSDEQIAESMVAGARLGALAGDRLMRSDALLRRGGVEQVAARLADRRAPRAVIVGASTSALASAVQLLKCHDLPWGAGAITLMVRTLPKPFFPSVEAAEAEGFTDFTPDDVCPVSGVRAAPCRASAGVA